MNPFTPSDRDWPEDANDENGNYLCHCLTCDQHFVGYKRRMTCKVCDGIEQARWNGLTPEQQEAETAERMERVRGLFDKLGKSLDKQAIL